VNRAERRRQQRAHAKTPVLIAGDGIVAAALGAKYEATGHAQLPDKQPGEHRWIATGAWVLRNIDVEKAHDPDTMKFLDNENLMSLSLGCWDCEQPLGVIHVGSHCPAEASE
jgi:hypothetical protein